MNKERINELINLSEVYNTETQKRIDKLNKLNDYLKSKGCKGFLKSKLTLKHFERDLDCHFTNHTNPFKHSSFFLRFDYTMDKIYIRGSQFDNYEELENYFIEMYSHK